MQFTIPVSIIIPAYNEGKFIRNLLESCVIQNVKEIIIGDNCSTDSTGEICRDYADKYPCIKYILHPKKIKPFDNFWFLAKKASCKYFSLIGGHDFYTDKNHLKCLYIRCKSTPTAIGAYSAVKYFDEHNNLTGYYHYFYAKALESDSLFQRISNLIYHLSDGTLIYGLYKRENLLNIIKENDEKALIDHLWIGSYLTEGKLLYEPDHYFGRRSTERTDAEKYYWYKEVFSTEDFPDLWLKQLMQLIMKANLTKQQRQMLKTKAMQIYIDIQHAPWIKKPESDFQGD